MLVLKSYVSTALGKPYTLTGTNLTTEPQKLAVVKLVPVNVYQSNKVIFILYKCRIIKKIIHTEQLTLSEVLVSVGAAAFKIVLFGDDAHGSEDTLIPFVPLLKTAEHNICEISIHSRIIEGYRIFILTLWRENLWLWGL